MLMSVVTLVGFVWIMYRVRDEPAAPERSAEARDGAVAAPSANAQPRRRRRSRNKRRRR